MAFLSTRWSNENPAIYLTGEYEYRNRTSSSVEIRVKLIVSKVNGLSYFGYNIKYRLKLAGSYVADWVTIKGNSPSQWSSPYVVYSDWHTISQPATSTSMPCVISMDSNSGKRTLDYSGTLTFPVGNTAPYWPSGAGARFNMTGTIPENTSSLTYSWDSATDSEGNSKYYKVDLYRNGSKYDTLQDGTTSRSFSLNNLSTILSANQSLYFRVYCKDSNTSYPSSYIQSNTITKNSMSKATLTSAGSIGFNTSSFTIVRTDATNTNGNTSFTYTLACSAVTVYNGNVSSLGKSITVSVWRSGSYPTGPYVKYTDIVNYVKNNKYTGSLPFTLTTANAYGTSGTSSPISASVNLKHSPTQSAIQSMTTEQTNIGGTSYYIINRKPVTITWGAATEPHGTAIHYTLQSSVNSGAWSNVATGLTSTSYTYAVRSISSSQKIKFRVISYSAYNTSNTGPASNEITLHYYNAPVMSDLKVNRGTDQCTLQWKYTQSSSISKVLYGVAFTVTNTDTGSSVASVSVGSDSAGSDSYDVSVKIENLAELDTYSFSITCVDAVASTFGLIPTAVTSILPRYSALLTIREKGVGINAVADSYTDFVTRGTSSHYGGDSGDKEQGTLNSAVNKSGAHNFYIGCYRGDDGELYASDGLTGGNTKGFRHVQICFGESTNPIRYRWGYSSTTVGKDAKIDSPLYTSWEYLSAPVATASVPVGASMEWNKSSVPSGYLLEDGRAVSRTTYSALFAVIGTTYGAGNGSTTFNLPDSRGRVAASYSTSYTETNALGKKIGVSTVTVPVPYHKHSQSGHAHSAHHNHSASTGSAGNHNHQGLRWVDNGKCISLSTGGSGGSTISGYQTGWSSATVYSNAIKTVDAGSHSHSVTVNTANVTTNTVAPSINYAGTSGATVNVFQPTIVKYKTIKY